MAKVLKGYYGWYPEKEADLTKSQTNVEVFVAGENKYSGNFVGVDHAKQAIAFVNSVLTLVGKANIVSCRMNTSFYCWVDEEEKKEE